MPNSAELRAIAIRFSVGSLIGEGRMTLGTVLLIVLLLVLIGAVPTWPYSREWGYYPSGGVGLVLVIVLILVLLGRL
jgi:hypothetical protein